MLLLGLVLEHRDRCVHGLPGQRPLCRGDQSPTASLRTLTDIYSPLSHCRPCLNQLYLAKTFKIASFILKGSSRARRV